MFSVILRRALILLLCVGFHAALLAAEPPYRINPGDVLKVFVWNEESLSGEFIVRPDGIISFPMAGQVAAGGRTSTEVETAIATGLSNFLRDKPVVTVSLLRLDGNIIYVLGKVNRPGAFPVTRRIDVTQALSLGGGLNTFADEGSIRILRRGAEDEQIALTFNYSAVKNGKKLDSNIILQSGDVVIVS